MISAVQLSVPFRDGVVSRSRSWVLWSDYIKKGTTPHTVGGDYFGRFMGSHPRTKRPLSFYCTSDLLVFHLHREAYRLPFRESDCTSHVWGLESNREIFDAGEELDVRQLLQ